MMNFLAAIIVKVRSIVTEAAVEIFRICNYLFQRCMFLKQKTPAPSEVFLNQLPFSLVCLKLSVFSNQKCCFWPEVIKQHNNNNQRLNPLFHS